MLMGVGLCLGFRGGVEGPSHGASSILEPLKDCSDGFRGLGGPDVFFGGDHKADGGLLMPIESLSRLRSRSRELAYPKLRAFVALRLLSSDALLFVEWRRRPLVMLLAMLLASSLLLECFEFSELQLLEVERM